MQSTGLGTKNISGISFTSLRAYIIMKKQTSNKCNVQIKYVVCSKAISAMKKIINAACYGGSGVLSFEIGWSLGR